MVNYIDWLPKAKQCCISGLKVSSFVHDNDDLRVLFLLMMLTRGLSILVIVSKLPWWLRLQRLWLQCRRHGFNLWVRRSPEEGNGYPLQYSCLENPMDRGAWRGTVQGVARVGHDWTTNILFQRIHFCFHCLSILYCLSYFYISVSLILFSLIFIAFSFCLL